MENDNIVFLIVVTIVYIGIILANINIDFDLKNFRPYRLNAKEEEFLEKNFKYYRELTPENKKEFSKRVTLFIKNIVFEGRQGLTVSREMKLLIAATGIKLTFGYEEYQIDELYTIIIYPDEYYSNLTRTYNKGETSTAGFIVFSWKDFLSGLANDHDKINLGFHEFTHALLKNWTSEFYNTLFSEIKQVQNIKEIKHSHLLRDYAYTNKMEFVACMVETFFECPQEIFDLSPGLYYIFSNMLNQNPLNKVESSYISPITNNTTNPNEYQYKDYGD